MGIFRHTSDSEYFDVTAVPCLASYEECAAVEDFTPDGTLRPAYDVRLVVKQVIPASLESHDITINADVSDTFVQWKNNNLCVILTDRL